MILYIFKMHMFCNASYMLMYLAEYYIYTYQLTIEKNMYFQAYFTSFNLLGLTNIWLLLHREVQHGTWPETAHFRVPRPLVPHSLSRVWVKSRRSLSSRFSGGTAANQQGGRQRPSMRFFRPHPPQQEKIFREIWYLFQIEGIKGRIGWSVLLVHCLWVLIP